MSALLTHEIPIIISIPCKASPLEGIFVRALDDRVAVRGEKSSERALASGCGQAEARAFFLRALDIITREEATHRGGGLGAVSVW
jgi:hypothetical protein